jgi:deoxyadenosine/deoxycytidine kinase
MGKKDKEHRKKVAARNQKIKGVQRTYEKMYNEQMKKYLEDLRGKYENLSGDTQETTGFVTPE